MPVAPPDGDGEPGVPGAEPPLVVVTATESNVDVFSCDVLWLVTASPTLAPDPSEALVLPTVVHVKPSAETEPVTVGPDRTSLSQTGAGSFAPASQAVDPPSLVRAMNSMFPLGVRSRMTFAAVDASELRNMMPAFAFALVFCIAVTRAMIWPSPPSGWYAKWNESEAPQMSLPAPATVNTPPLELADPEMPTAPTS